MQAEHLVSVSYSNGAQAGGVFRPAWWCRGRHAQTVWGAIGRPGMRAPHQRRRWELPDGDFLEVDEYPSAPNAPVLIVLHGLESSSRSSQVVGLLRAAHRGGWGGVGVNFRSCGGAPNRLRRSYHAGETGDLAWVIQRVIVEHPVSPILCAGFSLGGNVLLKYLGEQGDVAPPQLRATAAISAPFDLAISVRAIEQKISRVYMRCLLQELTRKTLAKLKQFPDLADPRALRALRTVAEFDELVTARSTAFRVRRRIGPPAVAGRISPASRGRHSSSTPKTIPSFPARPCRVRWLRGMRI